MPLGKEKVDTRKWKVDFLDQRVLVESTIYFLPSAKPAHAGSVHGGMRRCISRRAAQIASFFESRESPKHWGFEWPNLALIHDGGGGRIRTICVIS